MNEIEHQGTVAMTGSPACSSQEEFFRGLAAHYMDALTQIVVTDDLNECHRLAGFFLGSNPPPVPLSRGQEDDGPLTVSYPVHEIAHNLLMAHTGEEGGCPRVDWYKLRGEISDAIAMLESKHRSEIADMADHFRAVNVGRVIEQLGLAAQPPAPDVERRQTFVIPEGYEAVRDADGRATGEVRPTPSPASGSRGGEAAVKERMAKAMCERDGFEWDATSVLETGNGEEPSQQREYWLDKADAAYAALAASEGSTE